MSDEPAPRPRQYEGIPPDVVAGPTPPAKRLLDVVVSTIAVSILWPIFAIAAVLIKLDSPGPVLVKQRRVGLNGKEFGFYKFRTMRHSDKPRDLSERLPTGDLTKQLLSPKGRPRAATNIGWALRKTTVDELPQLLNVVKGDMSLVGPRPDMPEIVNSWPLEFRQRHFVKPGLTGLAVINGRSDLTHAEKVKHDLNYVQDHSFARDLMILVRTVALVFTKKGAR
jgi:lipopolysaccharide/colanic/teichoic acid biosynthesis glycosyltransferase